MIDSTTPTIVDLLHNAGLDLSIIQNGMLGVSPSTSLNDDLRNLIRENRAVLIDCVLKAESIGRQLQSGPSDQVRGLVRSSRPQTGAANSQEWHHPEPPTDPSTWHELQAAYRAHLTTCRTCMVAEHGNRMRCGAGVAFRLVQPDHQSRGQS
jgi:hypothetical protein